MKLSPKIFLAFDGRCEAAFRFYERCLDGKILFMLTWGDSPAAATVPVEWGAKIAHATIQVGDAEISGGDVPPESYEAPRGFEIQLNMSDEAAAVRIFQALVANGTVKMPLQKTFWARQFGILVDQFGIAWSINCS